MKNKLRRKLTALALCGVMIFSGSSSALADSQAGEIDENQIVQEQVLDEVIEEADTEVQEPAVEEATQELVPETVEPVIEEAPVEEVVEEVVEEPQEEIPTEEVVEEQPQVEIQEVEAQPTVVEKVVEAVSTATEKVVEVVETVIRYIIGMHDDLTYEDDQVIIKVYAEEDEIIPEGTKIKVVPILADDEATKAQYEEVAAGLQEKAAADEQIIEGFLAYDITLVDPEGNEFEPNGEVKVTMDYKKAALPAEVENVEEAEVTIHHFEEDANGEVKQIVDMVAEVAIEAVVEVTEAAEVEKAEFKTESFSVFTITWTGTSSRKATITVHYVDREGNELEGSQKQNVTLTSNSLDLRNYAQTITGYTYVRIDLDEVGSKEESRYLRVKNDVLQYSTNNSNWTDWETINENESIEKDIYIVYGSSRTITTVDSIAKNIEITLTDYSMWPDGNGRDQKHWAHNVIYSINDTHSFDFYPSGSQTTTPDYNQYTGGKEANQGFVSNNLNAGYPYVKATNNTAGESLNYLFNTNGKTYYQANHLFKMLNGYYVYDSAENFAQFDTTTQEFTVYGQPNKGFFPFNQYTDNVQIEAASTDKNKVTNHHFGMHVNFTFMQPVDGKVDGKDMIFHFSGDDDVWVFIDGMLVLDLGGIHQPVGGTINYATGQVTFDEGTTGVQPTSIYDMYLAAWEEAEYTEDEITQLTQRYFVRNEAGNYVFKNYSQHKLDFFYLERGAHDTNCNIKFNLVSIPENTVSVEKEITETNMADFADATFKFKLETSALDPNSSTGSYLPRSVFANETYQLYEVNGSQKTLVGEKHTDANGEFELKHRQLAEFEGIPASTKYWVTELDVVSKEYDEVKFNGNATIKNGANQEIGDGDFSTGELLAQECVYVKFQNKCNAENHRNLVINKVMANGPASSEEFDIMVQFKDGEDWVPYKGKYYLGNSTGTEKSTNNGIITLSAGGEAAYIVGLISDTRYKVTEVFRDGQADRFGDPLYSGTGKSEATTEPITGLIRIEDTNREYTVTVANRNLSRSVNVIKKFVGPKGTVMSMDTLPQDLASIQLKVREYSEEKNFSAEHTVILTKDSESGVFKGTITELMTYTEIELLEEKMLTESGVEIENATDWTGTLGELVATNDKLVYQVELTNKVSGTTSVTVNKQWNDYSNLWGTRPTKISVSLMNGEELVGEAVELSNSNEWTHTFTGLPKYNDNGTLITYTVRENGVPAGYVSQVDGTTITNTLDIQIIKRSSSNDKLTLAGAIFKLQKDDLVYYAESEADGLFSWYTTFANGQLSNRLTTAIENGTYTLSEMKAPAGYSVSAEKWTIEVNNGVISSIRNASGNLVPVEKILLPEENKTICAVYFENTALYELPSTGGFGIYVPMMSGVIMMMAAAFILMNNKRKEVL